MEYPTLIPHVKQYESHYYYRLKRSDISYLKSMQPGLLHSNPLRKCEDQPAMHFVCGRLVKNLG